MQVRARVIKLVCVGAMALTACESTVDGDEAQQGSEPALAIEGDAEGDALRWSWRRDASVATKPDASTPADASVADASKPDASAADASKPDASATSPDANTTTTPDASVPTQRCSVPLPTDARAENSTVPTTVVGTGTAASCTGSAFVAAVAKGGVITFNCGPDPVTITLTQTAKVFNDKAQKVIIDGGNKVTLSGGGRVRILYQNTCDQAQVWTTAHCDNQEFPQLTAQNLTFIDGNAKSEGDGGGAIFARGGRLKVINSRFYNNVCADVGPDVGGGAIRAFDQYNKLPLYVVNSTFGETGRGNVCSNGGALSSIGVSYSVIDSTFRANRAIGNGANPAQAGTPGGGSGGAIYNDGNTYKLDVCGSTIENNSANEGGGAIFYVSNDRSGTMVIRDSTLQNNPSGKFQNYPGMFVLANGEPTIVNSVVK